MCISDMSLMALPPCHMFCQFYVHLPATPGAKAELSCMMYQRSADLGLGIPFNIASYALLTHIIARVTDTEPRELIMQLGDAHVYTDHVAALEKQLKRTPRPFPVLQWVDRGDRPLDIDEVKSDDFEISGYDPHPAITMKMSV